MICGRKNVSYTIRKRLISLFFLLRDARILRKMHLWTSGFLSMSGNLKNPGVARISGAWYRAFVIF